MKRDAPIDNIKKCGRGFKRHRQFQPELLALEHVALLHLTGGHFLAVVLDEPDPGVLSVFIFYGVAFQNFSKGAEVDLQLNWPSGFRKVLDPNLSAS